MNKKFFKKSTGKNVIVSNNFRKSSIEKTFREMEKEKYEKIRRERRITNRSKREDFGSI